jgi:signal transduction histidine kinase/CheY-like chemotaxis protein
MITSHAQLPTKGLTVLQKYLALCFVVFFCALTNNIFAAEAQQQRTLLLSHYSNGVFPLDAYTTFFDPGQQATELSDITTITDMHWKPVDTVPPIFLLRPKHTLWYRVSITNDSNTPQTLLLRDSSVVIETMTAYVCAQPDNASSCKPTQLSSFNKNLTNIVLTSESTQTLYIKTIGFHSAFFTLNLYTPETFAAQQYHSKLYAGLIDGIINGITFYMLIIAIATRQAFRYAFYALGTCMAATVFIHQDFFHATVGIMPNEWLTNLSIIMPLLVGASLTQFVRLYTEAYSRHPKIDSILKVYIAATVATVAAYLLQTTPAILIPVYLTISSISLGLLWYLCATATQHPATSRLLLSVGLAMPLTTCSITLLSALGFIKDMAGYTELMQVMNAVEVVAFALAMLSSVKHLQHEMEVETQVAAETDIINRTHTQLLAHLNHELRTPLNGILGAAEILMHKSQPKDRHVFNMIYHTALPLKHLIDDMVDIKSITRNRKTLQNVRFDLHNLMQECMDVFLPVAQDKKIRFFFRIEHNVSTDITADANRLRQILLNLLDNACKFTHNGEVGVYVSHSGVSDGSNYPTYHFEVVDSGKGVSTEGEEKLFGAFETGDVEKNPKGTGLGLSIVHQLSTLLGGNCGYKKNHPSGSIFWFDAKVSPHISALRKTHKAFDGLALLIADENITISNNLAMQIADATSTTLEAHSREKLLDICDSIAAKNYNNTSRLDIIVMHETLADSRIINAALATNAFLIIYQDNADFSYQPIHTTHKKYEKIARKSSMEVFALQIADTIIHKSSVLQNLHTHEATQKSLKILVAEDIDTNKVVIEEVLKSLGFSAIVCSNGKEAYEAFIEHHSHASPFDVIIMDCEMPVQNGFDATLQIRQYEQNHKMPSTLIIALSAHTEQNYRQRSELAGMNAYLTKPITTSALLQCLMSADRSNT